MSRPGERNKLNEDHGKRQSSSLANGMENSHPICSSGEKRSHWRSYKLIIDPALKKGSHKLYRYDGQTFSVPNPGMPPVDIVRDPRIGRLWTKYKETDLPVPKFKIDECYIGRVPPKEVTFAKLNDNVREGFLTDMCKKFGEIEEVEILYNPKNKKHLGIAKVVFGSVKAAKDAVQNLHNTSVMGNIIHVELDPKGENRQRYFQRLINGSYTPLTLPVGGEEACEVSPRSLAEALLPLRRLSEGSSSAVGGTATPGGTNTPISLDTAYSSLRQDTPQSQGTPHTPRPSGTPFSQDSSYSSRQGTPAFQSNRAESSGGYKSRRHETKFQDAYNRRPERHYVHGTVGGVHRGNAEQPPSFKQHQPPEPPSPAFAHTPPPPASGNFKNAFSPYQHPIPPVYPHTEPSFHQPVQREVDYRRPPQAPPPPSTDFMPVRDGPVTPPIPEPQPPAPESQPATPPPTTPELCPSLGTPTQDSERNSLDSRIEMLLKPFLNERGDSDAEVRMDGSPISSSSSQLSPIPPQRPSRPSSTGLEDISPTPLPDSDDDEPILGTASLLANSRAMSPFMHSKSGAGEPRTPIDTMDTGHQSSGEDMEISDDEMPGTPNASGDCESIVVNSAMSPMQTIPMPPPGFPPLPPPQAGFPLQLPPLPTVPHLAGPPGVVPHPMLHPMHPYPPGMMPIMQMDLMSSLTQWGSVHMSFQMQTQMLSRMAQSQRPYLYPQFISGAAASASAAAAVQFGGPYPPLSMVGAPASTVGQEQPWHLTNMPKFNPAVPPPGYEPQKEDPHKATVDAVLTLIVKELKSIMKRDLNRKMVEVVAFRAFDEWWDKQERSAKATLTPVKTGEGKDDEKERAKPKETISSSLLENWNKVEGMGFEGMGLGIGLHGAIRLPSFKVKRKQPPEPTSSTDNKRVRPSTPVDDELEDEESERTDLHTDGSRTDGGGSSAKRRPARPLELDSEGEEEEETSGKEESSPSDHEEEPAEDASERLSSGMVMEDGEDDEKKSESDSSESESSDSSDDESSSLSSSSKSGSGSSGSESSSDYESSSGEEEEEEEEQVEGIEDEDEADAQTSSSSSSSTSSSSEEEAADVKAPSTPTGPPREEEPNELGRLEALDVPEIDHKHTAVSSIKSGVEDVWPPSPKGLPADKPDVDLAVSIPLSKAEATLEDVGSLRPATPTGSFADSDLDSQPKIPVEDFPRTPGRVGPVSLESEAAIHLSLPTPSMHLTFPSSHALEARSFLPPPEALPDMPVRGRLPTEEDIPRTPGRDLMDRSRGLGKSQSTDTVPVTPGSDTPLTGNSLSSPHIPGSPFSYPAQSPVLSAGIPRTPGRDLTFAPAFPDSAALSAGLPIHRKASSESLEEKSLFKEPLLSASPQASLPNNAVSSPFPGPPLPAASLQEPPLPLQGSSPTSVETSSSAAPKDLPVPVPLDTTPSKRKLGRLKSKKGPVTTPSDSEEPPAPMVASLPPDLPVNNLYPEHPSETFKREDGDSRALEEENNQTQTVIPEVEDRLLYVEEPIQKTRRQRRGWQELLLSMHSPVSSPAHPSFLPRSEFEEMTILYDIWNDGIDEEDISYLKITYDKMLQQDNGNDWLNDTLWVHHPPTNMGSTSGLKKKRKEDGIRDHVTGCARSEGYYKIDKKDKMKYLKSSHLQSEEPDVDTQGKSIPAQPQVSTRAGSERRSEQRRLLSSFSCDSDLLKFNQLKFRKKKIRFCKSHIHDWGLFAMEPIAADEMVIEYVGQNIRQVIADMREKRYEEKGIGSSYMFRVDHDTIIDATKCGNFARFINHSCNPNCYAKVITVESQKKIVIYSRQPINVNEEITYDYKFPIEDDKIPCLCGAENCRGTLN
ncbi:histone-lysine N-methyltransferase SETD1B-A-like isoform X1 [Carassius carassius]|uniref:histone-lysine N-methyltransferase SETD1B-A-like isoform X1 n=2 Tax=Carassius carassius TaxID=217509 RepID=UPI0028688911|nr:histone-lysine N-methyltransferase SETD1B-A-like isoform X1 [Carassius carassius]